MPTSTKLSAIATQAKNGLGILEYAIGDIWNQGGDSFMAGVGLTTYALMIPNLSRYLGKPSLLNPRIHQSSAVTEYVHAALTTDVGNYEWTLSLPPATGSTWSWAGTLAPTGSPQANASDVNALGEWYIDMATGWCLFAQTVQADWTLTYVPQVDGDMGSNATSNIIPDPNTEGSYGFQGCKIAYKNNTDNSEGYIIYLPPVGPLDSTRRLDRSPQSQFDVSGNSANMSTTPDTTPVLFWQHYDNGGLDVDATVGTYGEHYRYSLPKLITDNYSNGATLPAGMLRLWDHSQVGTILEGLTFTAEDVASPRSYVLIASGTALDTYVTNNLPTAYSGCGGATCLTNRDDHGPEYYPAAGLKLITVGNDVSSATSALTTMFFNHDHASANSLPGKLVDHGSLSNLFSPGAVPRLIASTFDNDDHPQYLYRGPTAMGRDPYKNGLLGDLFITSTNSSSNYDNVLANSKVIRLGSWLNGPWILYRHYDLAFNTVQSLDFYSNKITIGKWGGTDYGIEFNDKGVLPAVNTRIANLNKSHAQNPTGSSMAGLSIEANKYNAGAVQWWGEGRDGFIQCNRHYTGTYNDGNYDTQGGDLGLVRRYVIPANHFFVYRTSLAVSSYGPLSWHRNSNALNIDEPYTAFSVGAYGAAAIGIRMNNTGGGNRSVAFAAFDLPFAQYEIVNVRVGIFNPAGDTFGSGDLRCTLGYCQGGLGLFLGDDTIKSVDVADGEGAFSGVGSITAANAWQQGTLFDVDAVNSLLSITGTERVVSVLGPDCPTIPVIKFYAGNNTNLTICNVEIHYRITEF
jgi:hypothetical protein